MTYRCVACKQVLDLPMDQVGELTCPHCGYAYEIAPRFLRYAFDPLLYKSFRKSFLLNKVLNNNGYFSYQFIKKGSLSLPERPDVKAFKQFILTHASGGKLLDVGCGVLELPGYLDPDRFELYGLDPISDGAFRGMRIVGCSEYMPFADNSFDVLVYATSLDHVCSLEQTLLESHRLLKAGGRLMIWMSDRYETPLQKIKGVIVRLRERIKARGSDQIAHDYVDGRFMVYSDYLVLYIPKGGVDPFHSYRESPCQLIKLMKRAGFHFVKQQYDHKNQVFLCFSK